MLKKSTFVSKCIFSVQRLVNSDALVFLYTIGLAVSVGVLPWLPSIYPMIAARGVIGYSCGGLDIGQ